MESAFFSRSTSAFFKISVSGSDSRHTDEHPLATFDVENLFSSQIREVKAGMESEESKIKEKWREGGGGGGGD